MNEKLIIADLEFEIRRSPRRKTLGLTVDRSGELVVHSPAGADKNELRRWIERKLLWVHQKLLLKKEHIRPTNGLEIVSGESIAYLGRNYRLKIIEDQDEPLWFDGQWFYLRKADRDDAPRHFKQWYQKKGADWLDERVKFWKPKTGRTPSKVSVGELGFRWGSCGKNGVLRFNWRLLQLQVRLIDYVIAHELVHLHEHNHTPEFWGILDSVLPDWRERKDELGGKRAEMAWCADGGYDDRPK